MKDAPSGRLMLFLCLASAGWAYSFGLGTQVITHWLNQFYTNTIIGLNHATYYLGIALASFLVPWLLRRWGRNAAVIGMFLCGITLALFPHVNDLTAWFALRFLNGIGSAMSLIALETCISCAAAPEHRTRNFGFYAVALTLAGAAGIWTGLHWYTPGNHLPFWLGGISAACGGLLIGRGPAWPGDGQKESAPSSRLDLRANYLSFGTAWCQGFLEGGMLAFLSLYLLSLGLSADAAGTMMSVTMVGVIIFQVPVSWLGDRLGLIPTLLGCYAMVLAGLLVIPSCEPSLLLAVSLFFFGACSAALYPLGLGLLGERVPTASLSRAYAWYMAMDCIGSQVGAAAMGQARDSWGQGAMFPVGAAAVLLVLGSWGGLCWLGKKAPGRPVLLLAEEQARRQEAA